MSETRCNIWVAEEDDIETVARIATKWVRYEQGELSILPDPMDRNWGNQRGKISSKIIEMKRSNDGLRVAVISPALVISCCKTNAPEYDRTTRAILGGIP